MSPILEKVLLNFEVSSEILQNSEIEDIEFVSSNLELVTQAINDFLNSNDNISLREKVYLDNLLGYQMIKDLMKKKEELKLSFDTIDRFNSAFEKVINSDSLNEALINNELFYILFADYNTSTIGEWEKRLKQISDEVSKIHNNERSIGKLYGHIYKLNSDNEIIIIGDIHGDIYSLWQIFTKEKLYDLDKKQVIFLGDYIDRGNFQLSTLFLPLLLKKLYMDNIFLLKGNHENFIKESDGNYRANVSGDNDLFLKFWSNYISEKCMANIIKTLNDLPVLIELNSIIGIVHGGLPRPTNEDRYDDINSLFDLDTEERNYEMIWNRPVDKDIAVIITEESDFETSLPHFNNFIERLGWKFMVRGHCIDINGYKLFYNKRMATVFSSGSFMSYSGYQDYRPIYSIIRDNVFYIKKVYGNEIVETIDIKEL